MPRKAKGASQVAPDDSRVAPPPKLPRNARSRVRGMKGALRGVLELPMDLIWEICTHLDIGDLLALSNTNKSFRSVVTGNSSSTLFKRARQRIGLPELLSPMPDLRYAELMFGKGCNICGKMNAGKVDPSYRARICQACLKDKLVENKGSLRVNGWNRYTKYCLTLTTPKPGTIAKYYPDHAARMSEKLNTNFPASATSRSIVRDRQEYSTEFEGRDGQGQVDEEAFMNKQKIELHMSDWEFVTYLVKGYESLTPESDFQKWFLEFHKDRKLRNKDTEALQEWLKKMELKKTEENQKIRSGRREEIERRFEAMGFEKDEFRAKNFTNHAQVKSTRPLSDRTFTTTVEPPIRQVLEDNRRADLRSILKSQYEKFVKNHSERDYLPPSSVYLQLSILDPVLSDVSRKPSNSFSLPPKLKSAVQEEISKLVRNRREKLLRAIITAYTQLAQDSKKEKEKKKQFSASTTNFCSVDKLPLKLLSLPPWIPRSNDEPILASDEQLSTFLESSPLASIVECSKCRKPFSIRDMFKHLSDRWTHPIKSESNEYLEQKEEDWMRVCEFEKEEGKPFVRIDETVLSLSLKLQQLDVSTPLVVKESSRLPLLGDGYDLGEENPEWFKVSFQCACQGWLPSNMSLFGMYEHLATNSSNSKKCKIMTTVNYSKAHYERWRELRNRKYSETNEYVEGPNDWDSDVDSSNRPVFGTALEAYEDSEEEDEETKGECIVM